MEAKFLGKASSKRLDVVVAIIDSEMNFPEDIADIGIDIASYVKNHKLEGKHGEVFILPTQLPDIKNVVLVNAGKITELNIVKAHALGSAIIGVLERLKHDSANVYICEGLMLNKELLFNVVLGAQLKNYGFTKYKTKKNPDEISLNVLNFITEDHKTLNAEFAQYKHLYEGIKCTRDLISEPSNIKNPVMVAKVCKELEGLGVDVDILDEDAMQKLGMGSLLGVAQGSANPPRTVVMRFNGSDDKNEQPLAFIGKGVTFDSGGLSLKPADAMIGMKYDMSGAAVVIGLVKTLALRKAKVNVVAAVGLVENMPDGNAQRPEDIVTSMSGQTIEVLNTDAEGRLVLADVLWYVQSKYKPKFMIDLATLTGAIVISLADKYAGLFSNNDDLSDKLYKTGLKVGEKVWRFPLDKEYDKMMDSKIADMQNISNERGAGSITAAQFLQRFVNDVPWVHLDIAGVAHIKKPSSTHRGGSTAFGVMLLDQFLRDFYE